MKNFLLLILLGLLGCGGDARLSFYNDTDAGAEYGQTAEALTHPTWYGLLLPVVDSAFGGKCPSVWGMSQTCRVPADRTLRWRNDFPVVPPPNMPDFRTLFEVEVAGMQAVLAGRWLIQTGGTDSNETAALSTSSTACSDEAYACAKFQYSASFINNQKRYQYMTRCKMVFLYNTTSAINWGSLTPAQRDRQARNSIRHEMGHCLGLDHPDFQGTPHTELGVMYAPNTNNPNAEAYITVDEGNAIWDYMP